MVTRAASAFAASSSRSLRPALAAGAACLAVVAALAHPAAAAPARVGAGLSFELARVGPSHAARSKKNGSARTKTQEPRKDFGEMPKGPLQIVVSIADQHVTLYSNGVRVAQGPVSTGVPGRPTPTGVFSVIQKDRYHHSNLYSNAPMPYMQRITWSGVALHEGPLPGHPASHGCIRMTHDFAARLWVVTRLGARVIVARNEVVPVEFSHPRLFAPKAKPADPPVAGSAPGKRAERAPVGLAPVQLAQASAAAPLSDASPSDASPSDAAQLRGPVGSGAVVYDSNGAIMAAAAMSSSPEPAKPPLQPAEQAPRAAQDTPAETARPAEPDQPVQVSPAAVVPAASNPEKSELGIPDPELPPPASRADQPAKRSGHVAVFVSRKEKKIYVRQGFEPVFDMPVEIDHPEQPLGTHVFTLLGANAGGDGLRWNVMSTPPEQPRLVERLGRNGKVLRREPAPAPASARPPSTPAEALDRIHIPQEARDRIGDVLVPGSSLVVSDQGLGGETGRYTDFIVITH